MFHASIYLARRGDIVVVEAGDDEKAVAAGKRERDRAAQRAAPDASWTASTAT